MTLKAKSQTAIREIAEVLDAALPHQAEAMTASILAANRIVLHGVGREGLMMRSLAMRLYHFGADAHVLGDMTTPPLGPGDVLMVSAGPGHFSSIAALVDVAKTSGAETLCVTAQPDGAVPQSCGTIIHLAAQTMANDGSAGSVLPMGSLYEAAMFVFFEMVLLHLCDVTNTPPAAMRARHTNME